MGLKEKLVTTDAANQHLSKEAGRIKTDISTLLSCLVEVKSELNNVDAHQNKYNEY